MNLRRPHSLAQAKTAQAGGAVASRLSKGRGPLRVPEGFPISDGRTQTLRLPGRSVPTKHGLSYDEKALITSDSEQRRAGGAVSPCGRSHRPVGGARHFCRARAR